MRANTFYLAPGEAFNVASYIAIAVSKMVEEKNTQCETDKERELIQHCIDVATKLQERFENHA